VLEILKGDAARCYDSYEAMISQDGQQGLARELARMNLPANIYTQWYWKVDLHNLFHFLRLRADAHAQYEIRVYAECIAQVVKDWVPAAYAAWEDYRMGGVTLSSKAIDCVRRMLKGEEVTQETSGMSKGEWREFQGVWADLSAPLTQLSHAIRQGGNLGAHFDFEKEPDEDMARTIVELLDYLVSYLYVLPRRIEKLETKLQSAVAPETPSEL
jgi:hypothetical protein